MCVVFMNEMCERMMCVMYDSVIENGKKIPRCRTFSVQFEHSQALIISNIAARCGRSSSFVIRGLCLSYLEEHPELIPSSIRSDHEDPADET